MLHVAANTAFFDGTAKALAAYLVLSVVFVCFRSAVDSPVLEEALACVQIND